MRDDFQVPNIGEAPSQYEAGFFARMARNIENALTTMRSPGHASVNTLALTPVPVSGLANLKPRAGWVAYVSNGRKNGEGVGSGTGVLCFYDGTAWIACDTGQTVSA